MMSRQHLRPFESPRIQGVLCSAALVPGERPSEPTEFRPFLLPAVTFRQLETFCGIPHWGRHVENFWEVKRRLKSREGRRRLGAGEPGCLFEVHEGRGRALFVWPVRAAEPRPGPWLLEPLAGRQLPPQFACPVPGLGNRLVRLQPPPPGGDAPLPMELDELEAELEAGLGLPKSAVLNLEYVLKRRRHPPYCFCTFELHLAPELRDPLTGGPGWVAWPVLPAGTRIRPPPLPSRQHLIKNSLMKAVKTAGYERYLEGRAHLQECIQALLEDDDFGRFHDALVADEDDDACRFEGLRVPQDVEDLVADIHGATGLPRAEGAIFLRALLSDWRPDPSDYESAAGDSGSDGADDSGADGAGDSGASAAGTAAAGTAAPPPGAPPLAEAAAARREAGRVRGARREEQRARAQHEERVAELLSDALLDAERRRSGEVLRLGGRRVRLPKAEDLFGRDAAAAACDGAPDAADRGAVLRRALGVAVAVGHEGAALALLREPGLALFEEGGGGAALLRQAAGLGRAEVVQALLGAPGVAWVSRDLWAAFHSAAVSGRADAARLLAPALQGAPLPHRGLLALLSLAGDAAMHRLVLDALGPAPPGAEAPPAAGAAAGAAGADPSAGAATV